MKEGGPELVGEVVGAEVVGAAVVETVLGGSAKLRGSVVLETLKTPTGPEIGFPSAPLPSRTAKVVSADLAWVALTLGTVN